MKRRPFALTIIVMAATVLLFLGMVITLNSIGYHAGYVDPAQHRKLKRLSAKLEEGRQASVVFVGDSGLGRAVEEGRAGELLGKPAAVYSLTGAFGYAGTYNMARRALRANNPEVVVVFQSILRMTGPDSVPGYVLTEEGLPNSEGPLLHQRVTMYLSLTNAVAVARNLGNAAPAPARADEEVIREPVRTERKKGGNERFRQLGWYRLSPDALYPGKDQYLRLTGEACREAGVVCVYVHGPIYYRYCDGYEAYMEALNAKIAAAGFLILDPAPRCVSEVEIDDTQDHIHWDLQQDFTAWYAQRLRAALALLPERPVIGN